MLPMAANLKGDAPRPLLVCQTVGAAFSGSASFGFPPLRLSALERNEPGMVGSARAAVPGPNQRPCSFYSRFGYVGG